MDDILVCPNCGKRIELPAAGSPLTCPNCREALLVSADRKIVLANPIRTYLKADDLTERNDHDISRSAIVTPPPLSSERRKRTARLAYERMTQQEQLDYSGLVYGILAMILGGFVCLFGWLRTAYIQNDWIGWMGFGIGVPVFAIGTFVTTWFYRSIRSAKTIKRAIKKEMQG